MTGQGTVLSWICDINQKFTESKYVWFVVYNGRGPGVPYSMSLSLTWIVHSNLGLSVDWRVGCKVTV